MPGPRAEHIISTTAVNMTAAAVTEAKVCSFVLEMGFAEWPARYYKEIDGTSLTGSMVNITEKEGIQTV